MCSRMARDGRIGVELHAPNLPDECSWWHRCAWMRYPCGVLRDTSAAALDRYFELLRALSPEARLRKASALTHAVRQLAIAGIRLQYPHASPEEVRMHLAMRLYGADPTRRMFGRVPNEPI